ncbi:cysteinyl-tRNA synthetase [Thermotoga neapolitana LA10]|nr:hypothetical protein TRQ7_06880 [Thermotoga sp. RQ7]KFZ21760.1 cysteinyl-tRNA synthetase [Thermotoga neapolitana LA10]
MLISIIALIIASCGMTFQDEWEIPFKNWLYQLQNADPSEIASSGFELAVIDYSRDGSEKGEYSQEEIKIMLDAGVVPVAYLNIGQAEDYRFYWKNDWYENPPEWLGEEDKMWPGNYFVKYWYPEWKDIIFSYIDRILSQGFKGVYLDRVDSFEYWSSTGQISKEEAARRMIDLIEDIAEYIRKENPDILIIPQNGENILEFDDGRILSFVSGWSVENLFYLKTTPLPDEETESRIHYLDMLRWHGKFVLSVDYVDDGSDSLENLERILDYYKKCEEKVYIPYAAKSDLQLDEVNIIEGIQPAE